MGATHELCLQVGPCADHTDFTATCVRCGFYKPEHDRRVTLPLTFCEDGLRRYIVSRKAKKEDD